MLEEFTIAMITCNFKKLIVLIDYYKQVKYNEFYNGVSDTLNTNFKRLIMFVTIPSNFYN